MKQECTLPFLLLKPEKLLYIVIWLQNSFESALVWSSWMFSRQKTVGKICHQKGLRTPQVLNNIRPLRGHLSVDLYFSFLFSIPKQKFLCVRNENKTFEVCRFDLQCTAITRTLWVHNFKKSHLSRIPNVLKSVFGAILRPDSPLSNNNFTWFSCSSFSAKTFRYLST